MTTNPIAVVTGGCGFIGSHVVELLIKNGYYVHIIDNLSSGHLQNLSSCNHTKFTVFNIDILDLEPNHEAFAGASYVFHFAGIGDIVPSIDEPFKYMSVNVLGTVKVLECSRFAKVNKLVYAASSSCYGLATVPTKENNPISTKYPYALSKFQGEQAILHWGKVYGLSVNSIRIFNAYGTRSRTSGAYGAVFGVFLKQKLSGAPFTVVGDGNQSRDFLYVTDVARAFYSVAESAKSGEIYNLGAGSPQKINYLVSLLGGEVIYLPKRPAEPDCTWADITKITNETGWKPIVSFEAGVSLMLENIEYWADAPLWKRDGIINATKSWFEYLKD